MDKKFKELSEQEKLELFSVEELEGRLETAWNDVCTNDECSNDGCGSNNNCEIEQPKTISSDSTSVG